MTTPKLILDIEAVASEVAPSPPRPNMANEVLVRLSDYFRPMLSGATEEVRTLHHERLREILPHPEAFPPPPCWKVVCVGVALLDSSGQLEDLSCLMGDSEEEILREVARVFSEDKSSPFEERDVVTFNGRGFDLPVLTMRAARYGVQLPFWSSRWHYRYSESPHFDLLDFWSAYGGSPKVSLTQMARLFGLPGKREGEDGGSVEAMVKEGRLEDVRRYCLSDVVQTAGVFLRTEHFRGRMHTDQYRPAAWRLLEACEGAFGEGLSWVSEGTDRNAFLLERA